MVSDSAQRLQGKFPSLMMLMYAAMAKGITTTGFMSNTEKKFRVFWNTLPVEELKLNRAKKFSEA